VTGTDLLAALTQIFRENFDDEKLVLAMTTTARDIPGWDSAKMVFLVLAVEERFGVRFRSKEIDALRSIGDWVALIEAGSARPLPA
jgi:acyl carrier protein